MTRVQIYKAFSLKSAFTKIKPLSAKVAYIIPTDSARNIFRCCMELRFIDTNFKCIGDEFTGGKHTKCLCLFHRFSPHRYELQFRQKHPSLTADFVVLSHGKKRYKSMI